MAATIEVGEKKLVMNSIKPTQDATYRIRKLERYKIKAKLDEIKLVEPENVRKC